MQTPDRDEGARRRRRGQGWVFLIALSEGSEEVSHVDLRGHCRVVDSSRGQECRPAGEITCVGRQRVPGHPALDIEVRQPGGDGTLERCMPCRTSGRRSGTRQGPGPLIRGDVGQEST